MKRSLKRLLCAVLSAAVITPGVPVLSAAADETDFDEQMYIMGDVNCDKRVTLKDASLVQRAVISLEDLDNIQYALGCVDGSEYLSLKDAYIIQRYTLGIIDEYPMNSKGKIIGDVVYFDTDSDTQSDVPDTDSVTDTLTDTATDSTTDTSADTTTDSTTDTAADTATDTVTDTESSDTDISEGFKATFNCTDTYAIVYYNKEMLDGVPASDITVYARDDTTGNIDTSGNGVIYFELSNYGMMIADDVQIEGQYDELIRLYDNGFAYKITGVKSDLTITAAGYYGGVIETETDTDTASSCKAVFDCTDTYAIIYYTRESAEEKLASQEDVYARNPETGEIDTSGEGEINFSLYNNGKMIYTDIKIRGEYDELLTVDYAKFRYRITGVKSDLIITVQGFYTGLVENETQAAPYDILPIEDIQYMLDGNFDRGSSLGDTWKQGYRTRSNTVALESSSRTDGSKCLKLSTTGDYSTFAYNSPSIHISLPLRHGAIFRSVTLITMVFISTSDSFRESDPVMLTKREKLSQVGAHISTATTTGYRKAAT